jgi:superkiller protein 3
MALAIAGVLAAGCASSNPQQPKGINHYIAAVKAYDSGNRKRAVSDLIAATRANPDLIMSRLMLGDLYREGGQYSDAADQYKIATRLDPSTWSNYFKLGVSYQFLQKMKLALANYDKALKLNPDDANTNMNAGLVHLYLGDKQEAVKYAQRATELDPKSAAAFSNLGVALDSVGQYARAEAAYRHSLDIDPGNMTTQFNLGTNLIAQKRSSEAVDILQKVVAASATPLHRTRYAEALTGAGRFDDAVSQCEMALKDDAKYYPAMNQIAAARIAQYQAGAELDDSLRNQAIKMWNQSLAIDADQPQVQAAKKRWSSGNLLR